jgi:hypothetical protein
VLVFLGLVLRDLKISVPNKIGSECKMYRAFRRNENATFVTAIQTSWFSPQWEKTCTTGVEEPSSSHDKEGIGEGGDGLWISDYGM